MAYDINCPHCGYGYTPEELFKTNQLNKAGTFKANCRTLCKKDFEIEVVPSFNYFENKIEDAPMDLIEQLGGCEKAKQKYSEHAFDLAWGDIEKTLLEYRRINNIFELGDKVVFTDILNSCVVTFESTETEPMQIVWLTYPDGTAGYVFHLNKIKHATDAEIKAGHRL
jgi:hypothetical protein